MQIDIDRFYFGGNRESTIQRDGEKCVKCSITRYEHKEKYGRDITVNHIDGNGRNTAGHLKNNSLSNLETLCLSCHGKKDIQRRRGGLKLNIKIAEDIRKLYAKGGITQREISEIYNVSRIMINHIIQRKEYK